MDGDVMLSGSGLPTLLAIGGTILGGVFGLLKWFAARLLADIETKLSRVDAMEDRIDRILADLPLSYQRREDFVREMKNADDRYHRIVDSVIETMREEISSQRARVEALEKQRESDVIRYQHRDDAIREFTAINAKLDRLYELLARRNDP